MHFYPECASAQASSGEFRSLSPFQHACLRHTLVVQSHTLTCAQQTREASDETHLGGPTATSSVGAEPELKSAGAAQSKFGTFQVN